MSAQKLFRAIPRCTHISKRYQGGTAIATGYTSDVIPTSIHLPDKTREERPTIGTREIVGYGINGKDYVDVQEYPFPAVRFREDTPEIIKLRQKEKGPWQDLTIDEIKTLYRASFCSTYAEIVAPTGEWKATIADIMFWISVTFIFTLWMDQTQLTYHHTINPEWATASLELHVKNRRNPISGIASWFDYETGQFKPNARYLKYMKHPVED